MSDSSIMGGLVTVDNWYHRELCGCGNCYSFKCSGLSGFPQLRGFHEGVWHICAAKEGSVPKLTSPWLSVTASIGTGISRPLIWDWSSSVALSGGRSSALRVISGDYWAPLLQHCPGWVSSA